MIIKRNRFFRIPGGALLAALILAGTMVAAGSAAHGQEFPPRPKQSVNDYAGIIGTEDRSALEALNREVLAKSGVAIVVATFPDLGGAAVEDYANRLGRAWGIGSAETDRGILFLVAEQEKRARIETGYGVEGYLPDGKVGAILDQFVIPSFRQGDFSQGIRRGNEALAVLTAEEYGFELTGAVRPVPGPTGSRRKPGGILGSLFSVVLLILFIGFAIRHPFLALFLLSSMGGRGGGGFGGGGGGGFGGFGGGSFGGGGASRGW